VAETPARGVSYNRTMDIVLNGRSHQVDSGVRIDRLVAALGFAGKRIAVERNGQIVPRSRHGETEVQPGDRIEIVVAVGGG
jgi:sulfur carrier protein